MAPPHSGAGVLDVFRSLERRLQLPSNVLFPVLLGAALLAVFAFQSASLSCDSQETQVRRVSTLKSAVEELGAVQAEDRKELAQVLQQLEEARSARAKLQQWRINTEKKAQAAFDTLSALLQDMNRMLEDTQKAVAKAGLGKPPPPLTEDALVERLKASKKEVQSGQKEIMGLTKGGKAPGGDRAVNLLPAWLTAVRIRMEELKGALSVAVDAAAVGAQEAEGPKCDKKDLEKCNSLVKTLEELKKLQTPGTQAIAECTETVLDLSLRLQEEKSATRSRASALLRILERASQSPSFSAPLKKELQKAAETCKKSGVDQRDTPHSLVFAMAPAAAGSETCRAMGCRCSASAVEMDQFLNYTAHATCPDDWLLVQHLIVEHNCHSLPRRRCFAPNWPDYQEPLPLPQSLWNTSALMDSNVRWEHNFCQNFSCLLTTDGAPRDCPGCFNFTEERSKLDSKMKNQMSMTDALITINNTLRIGLDLGGGTGTFAAMMAEQNVTILTTGVDVDSRTHIGGGGEETLGRNSTDQGMPYMETVALRGLVPLHLPHNARLPFFDGTLDIIHAAASVDGMTYEDFEDAFFDWDRVLRPGGLIWFSLFHSQVRKMPQYMETVELFKYKFLHRTVTPSVRPDGLHVYVNFLIEKPRERDVAKAGPAPFE